MSCKHLKVEGNTTKYYFCKVKNKAIDKYDCKNCLLKIETLEDVDVVNFLKGFRK